MIGGDWALIKPGMLEELIAEMEAWEGDALTETFLQDTIVSVGDLLEALSPRTRPGLDALLAAQASDPGFGANADLAIRQNNRFGRNDLGLLVAWMRARQPTPELDPLIASLLREERLPSLSEQSELLDAVSSGVALERPRTWMLGAEYSSFLGPVGIRAEGRWTQLQTVATSWMGTEQVPSLAGGMGLDWVHGSTLGIVLEGSWTHLVAPPEDLWLQAEDQVQIALGSRLSLLAERLQIEQGVLWDVHFNEWVIRPGLSWRPRDSIRADLSLLLLLADEPAPRSFQDAMRTTLGPIGYASDNDSLVLSIAWIK
jgi:hypothetical protein